MVKWVPACAGTGKRVLLIFLVHPEVARDAVAGAQLDQRWRVDFAARLGVGAARVEGAARSEERRVGKECRL